MADERCEVAGCPHPPEANLKRCRGHEGGFLVWIGGDKAKPISSAKLPATSAAKFHLVPRSAILASGDSDDFHHVSDDEVVLVAVEALERAERERDEQLEDSERIIAALVRERDALKAALRDIVDAMEGGYDAPSESDAKKRAREALGEVE